MLTQEQLTLLGAAIAADPVLAAYPNDPDGNTKIAKALNSLASPAWIVWRTSVGAQEWRQAILGGGGATQLDALTASKRDSLLWACNDVLDPSVAAVRAALDDFCGTQNNLKSALQAAQKREATRAEQALSTGTGSSASPATLGWEGELNDSDVEQARAA